MHIRRIPVAKYPYPIRIRSNKEITIRILSVSVKIADIRKISIRGYISAHLWFGHVECKDDNGRVKRCIT